MVYLKDRPFDPHALRVTKDSLPYVVLGGEMIGEGIAVGCGGKGFGVGRGGVGWVRKGRRGVEGKG